MKQFEHVVKRHWFLVDVVKVDPYLNLKLAPARLGDFVGRLGHDSVLVGVALAQPELDLFDVGRHVFVVDRLHIHPPVMSMAVEFTLLPEVVGDIAKQNTLRKNMSEFYEGDLAG